MGENEQTDKSNTDGKEADKAVETVDKPLNLVEEAKIVRDEILEAKAGLKKEKEELLKVKSEAVLAGTGGGHIEPKTEADESPHDYRIRIQKEMAAGKTEFGN